MKNKYFKDKNNKNITRGINLIIVIKIIKILLFIILIKLFTQKWRGGIPAFKNKNIKNE